MITKNQKLMLVSSFALKAKMHLGVIKLTEMIENERYAFDKLTRAILTRDSELTMKTKIVSYELKIGHDLIKAVDSYIQNINQINNEEEFFGQSKSVLTKFANQLYGIKINGANYRQAVERLLQEVNTDERTFSINLARKFYPYCAGLNHAFDKDKNNEKSQLIEQKKAFIKTWDSLDDEFFYDKEISTLGLYVDFMRANNYPEKDITISEKIAKVITLEIRNKHIKPENAYRDAVNKTQAIFDNDELKSLTMLVSREYHNFWIKNIPQLWGYL